MSKKREREKERKSEKEMERVRERQRDGEEALLALQGTLLPFMSPVLSTQEVKTITLQLINLHRVRSLRLSFPPAGV